MRHLLQTSKAELLVGLQQLGALEWDSRWMLVDPECVSTLMELLQLTLTECGWHWASTPQQELERKMQETGYDARCLLSVDHPRSGQDPQGCGLPSQEYCLLQSPFGCPAVCERHCSQAYMNTQPGA